MCDACLIESVKKSMLSRRSLFTGAAATTVAVVASGLTTAKPALAQASGKVVDLTHAYDGAFPTFDGNPGILYEPAVKFADSGYQLWKLTIFEHTGTHIDAPLHFTEDGTSVADLPPDRLVCPLCIIDIKAKAAEDPNAMVEPADIEAYVSANGAIPAGACVAMNSGWAAKVGDPSYRNNPEGKFAFPGFSKAATDMLAGLDVACIGWIRCPSTPAIRRISRCISAGCRVAVSASRTSRGWRAYPPLGQPSSSARPSTRRAPAARRA